MIHTATLRAKLHDPVVFPRRLDHPTAFDDVVARRFLGVNILACLAREDRDQRVPVVRRGVDNDVDLFVVEQAAEVLFGTGSLAAVFLDNSHGLGEIGVVDVADGDDLGSLVAGKLACDFGAAKRKPTTPTRTRSFAARPARAVIPVVANAPAAPRNSRRSIRDMATPSAQGSPIPSTSRFSVAQPETRSKRPRFQSPLQGMSGTSER